MLFCYVGMYCSRVVYTIRYPVFFSTIIILYVMMAQGEVYHYLGGNVHYQWVYAIRYSVWFNTSTENAFLHCNLATYRWAATLSLSGRLEGAVSHAARLYPARREGGWGRF